MNNFKSLFCFNTMLLVLLLSLASCERNEPGIDEPTRDEENTKVGVLHYDREGLNIDPENSLWLFLGQTGFSVNEDYADDKFAYVGEKELSEIRTVPTEGWKNAIYGEEDAPESEIDKNRVNFKVGQCYVIQYITYKDYIKDLHDYRYIKLRVIEIIGNENDLLSERGIKIEYVAPFFPEIKLMQSDMTISAGEGSYQVPFHSPACVSKVEGCPDWIKITFERAAALLTVSQNTSKEIREANICLINGSGKVKLTVRQEGYGTVAFAGGNGKGTNEDPFLVATPEQLDNVRSVPWASFRQIADIDLADIINKNYGSWQPILNFNGVYDGGGYAISNLTISTEKEFRVHWDAPYGVEFDDNFNIDGFDFPVKYGAALFGSAQRATFKNIRLKIGTRGISTEYLNAAGICAFGQNITIIRCSVTGSKIYSEYGCVAGIALSPFVMKSDELSSTNVKVTESYTDIVVRGNGFLGMSVISAVIGITDGQCRNCYVMNNVELENDPGFAKLYVFGLSDSQDCYIIGSHTGTYSFYLGRHEYGSSWTGFINSTSCYSLRDKTEAELKRRSTYVGWDFDNVWTIDEGVSYPKLRCFEKM
ncbi:MAG: BACON domain-containing protein [Bacteroidales bacterium]|nr:BACON domain-containing protein [Bacteroidales bacterium]